MHKLIISVAVFLYFIFLNPLCVNVVYVSHGSQEKNH